MGLLLGKTESQPIEPLPEFTTSEQHRLKIKWDEALEFASVDTSADEARSRRAFEIKQVEGITFQESDEDWIG